MREQETDSGVYKSVKGIGNMTFPEKMTLSELTNRLQNLCHDGLARAYVQISGKNNIVINYDDKTKTLNIEGEAE